jgi:hypothetical protein
MPPTPVILLRDCVSSEADFHGEATQQHGRSQANARLAMLMEIVKMTRGRFAAVANN